MKRLTIYVAVLASAWFTPAGFALAGGGPHHGHHGHHHHGHHGHHHFGVHFSLGHALHHVFDHHLYGHHGYRSYGYSYYPYYGYGYAPLAVGSRLNESYYPSYGYGCYSYPRYYAYYPRYGGYSYYSSPGYRSPVVIDNRPTTRIYLPDDDDRSQQPQQPKPEPTPPAVPSEDLPAGSTERSEPATRLTALLRSESETQDRGKALSDGTANVPTSAETSGPELLRSATAVHRLVTDDQVPWIVGENGVRELRSTEKLADLGESGSELAADVQQTP